MDILMVTAELGPFARATEAGDAVPALAKALKQLGHRVTVALPRYSTLEAHGLLLARRLTPLPASGGDVTVFDCQLPSGVEVVLFDLPALSEPAPFGDDRALRPEALAAHCELGRAAAALVNQRATQNPFDVVHAHDWPGGLVAAYLEAKVPLVLSIHDAARAGWFPNAAKDGLDPRVAEKLLVDGGVCALAAGLRSSSLVVTPSPSYAASLTEAEVTGPLAGLFAALPEPVIGVPSGLDYASQNPAVDASLEARYDAEDSWLKARTKGVVLREHRLELDILRPLVCFAGPLDAAHGADVLLAALPALRRERVSLIVALGSDDPLAPAFHAARDENPDGLALVERRDEVTIRRLLAASDIALVATRSASAETGHVLAQRYGAVPVALASGTCLDGIVDAEASLETGTGFLFDRPEALALLGALGRALSAYASEDAWARLRRRVMCLDLSWDRPARRHSQLYRRLAEG
jgi:starch synthase